MTWSLFYMIVAAFITLVLLLIALPWLKHRRYARADFLSNTQIVRQRLQELEREHREGLISDADKKEAEKELKLSLVDESAFQAYARKGAKLPLIAGAVIAIATGVVVYAGVNHLPQLNRASLAIEQLPSLSERLASGEMSELTQQDLADLALAIRQRLTQTPDDDTGWMYFGRLMMSLGQDEQALASIERAVKLAPEKKESRITLAQVLMALGDATSLRRAQQQLQLLLDKEPENDNLVLMMAVVSAQLGDLDTTTTYFNQVRDRLPPDSDIFRSLTARLEQLQERSDSVPEPSVNGTSEETGFSITVSLSPAAAASLPESGFLIVFAQDANSDNKMPAAVVRMPLPSFPVTVKLTTDNAMLPNYSLTSLDQVRLSARISFDSDVAPATGEWQGTTQETVQADRLSPSHITIDKEL